MDISRLGLDINGLGLALARCPMTIDIHQCREISMHTTLLNIRMIGTQSDMILHCYFQSWAKNEGKSKHVMKLDLKFFETVFKFFVECSKMEG